MRFSFVYLKKLPDVVKIEIDTFRYIYDLNVIGPLVAMQEVIPLIKLQGGGTIINISSGTALVHMPGMNWYSSSKRALVGISLAARQDAGRQYYRQRRLPLHNPDKF